jgi:methionyl-tRNA formyltransferase
MIRRIIFAGTPEFAAQSLQEIHKNDFEIVGVFTQPDRKSGRGKKITKSAVKVFAESQNLPVFQPEKIKECEKIITDLKADIMVVVAFGQILPQDILDIPHLGCLNIHASLLPRWRGAAPIQRAILAGDKTTGVGIMQMDAGLDTGGVLLEKTCEITDADTASSLHDKLADLGKNAIVETLKNIEKLTPQKQIGEPTYAKKLLKNEAEINWGLAAVEINRQVRAFNPYPISQTVISSDKFENQVLRILEAEVIENIKENIFQDKNNLIIKCGKNALSLKMVQLAGKKAVKIQDFNNAYKNITINTSK